LANTARAYACSKASTGMRSRPTSGYGDMVAGTSDMRRLQT